LPRNNRLAGFITTTQFRSNNLIRAMIPEDSGEISVTSAPLPGECECRDPFFRFACG
jgi:hypothetical protein